MSSGFNIKGDEWNQTPAPVRSALLRLQYQLYILNARSQPLPRTKRQDEITLAAFIGLVRGKNPSVANKIKQRLICYCLILFAFLTYVTFCRLSRI